MNTPRYLRSFTHEPCHFIHDYTANVLEGNHEASSPQSPDLISVCVQRRRLGKICGSSPLSTVHSTSSSLTFFSSTLFTCKFLPGLALCSLLAVSFSCFRHSQTKETESPRLCFLPFFTYTLGW